MATPTNSLVTLFVSSIGRTVGTQIGLLAVEGIATTETVEAFSNANRLTEIRPGQINTYFGRTLSSVSHDFLITHIRRTRKPSTHRSVLLPRVRQYRVPGRLDFKSAVRGCFPVPVLHKRLTCSIRKQDIPNDVNASAVGLRMKYNGSPQDTRWRQRFKSCFHHLSDTHPRVTQSKNHEEYVYE